MKRVVCFGETLLRLGAMAKEPLLRTSTLHACFGGAETNVAVSLAHFGMKASVVTVLPENALGDACLAELRGQGVDTTAVKRAAGRMGLYFFTPGAMLRPAQVIYDRANSAFANFPAAGYDWNALLTGADWLHVTGITPALSKSAEQALLAALDSAAGLGVPVSFDCNYRPALWQGREKQAAAVLRGLAERATLLFGGVRDVALLFGIDRTAEEPATGFRKAAEAVFADCPKLETLAATHRTVHGAEHHELSAHLADRSGVADSGPMTLNPIVDRVGSGDAFAAGILFGLGQKFDRQKTVAFALAAAALKHTLPGDFNVASAAQVLDLTAAAGGDIRR